MKQLLMWSLAGWMAITAIPTAYGARKIRFSDDKNHIQIKDKELAMAPTTGRAYAESWNVWTWNKAGYNIYALIVSTRMVLGTKLGVQLTIRSPDGKVEHKMVEYSLGKFRFKKNKLDILVPGKHRITFRRDKGFLVIDFDKWGIRFNFKRIMHGSRLQRGPICMKGKCYIGLAYAPRMEVSGFIRVNGKKIDYKGIGYADHSWQNLMPHHISRRWYAARALSKHYTVIATHLAPPRNWSPQSIPGLAIAKDNKWIFQGNRDNLKFVTRNNKVDAKSGYSVPHRVIYRGKGKDGLKVKVDITHLEEYDNFDILSQFNTFLRFLIQKLISKPFLFRHKAKMKVTLTTKDGKTEKFTLTAFTEWTFLNK